MLGLSFVASSKPSLRSIAGRGARGALQLDDVDGLGAEVVGHPLTDALALLDEVRADERHVERLVLGVDRAVGEDDGDVGVLGLLEHAVPAGLDDRRERDVVDALGDVGPDRLDLVLLLLLGVREAEVEPGVRREGVLDRLRVGGTPAALGADLAEADGDRVAVAAAAAAGLAVAGVTAAARRRARARAPRYLRRSTCVLNILLTICFSSSRNALGSRSRPTPVGPRRAPGAPGARVPLDRGPAGGSPAC